MMQAFRNSAKPLIYIVTASFFLWLVLDLSGLTGGSGLLSQTRAGKVNGETIEARTYISLVQQAIEEQQRQSPTRLGLEDIERIRDDVWEQVIQNTVLRREYTRRGITVSPEELAEIIRNVPPAQLQDRPEFQTDGQFDLGKYQRWLTSSVAHQFVPLLELQYRDEIMRSKLLRVVTADVYLSDPALWERYRDQSEMVKVGLVAILPRRAIPDSAVAVSDAEVEAYYKAHPDEFKRTPTAYLSFVALPRLADASDSAAALARARTIRQEILDGAPFAEVAQRESSDSVSAANGGDLGQFSRGSMVPAFDEAAFRLPLNTLSEPILSEFGYHLIEITSRKADTASGRHILIRVEPTGAHRDRLDAEADSLEALGAERMDPAALDTVARALNLPVGRTTPVQKGSRVQLGLQVIPDAGTWAFQAKPGEISPVIETPFAYYLFRLDSAQTEQVPALGEVRLAVTIAVRDEKKVALARKLGEDYLKRVGEGSSMEQAANALGLPYRELGPFNRIESPVPNAVLTGAAFGLPASKMSGLLDTDDGMYVVNVLERTPADTAAFQNDLDEFRGQMIRLARQERVRSYLDALRKAAVVVDQRASLFPTTAQAEEAAAGLPAQPPAY
jgi:peptidyl-prolyl cis-trans isomerase D